MLFYFFASLGLAAAASIIVGLVQWLAGMDDLPKTNPLDYVIDPNFSVWDGSLLEQALQDAIAAVLPDDYRGHLKQ